MGDQPVKDLRQLERVRLKDGVYLAFKPDLDVLGPVKDVSLGGVCFEYLGYQSNTRGRSVDIDIFTRGVRVQLKKCKVAYDTGVSTAFAETRRCGLQFPSLTLMQASDILAICKRFEIND